MSPDLAVEAWIVTAIVLPTLAAIAIALIVIAPWRSVRREPPLDDAVETRLLLNEDPQAIAEDEDTAGADEGDETAAAIAGADPPGPAA